MVTRRRLSPDDSEMVEAAAPGCSLAREEGRERGGRESSRARERARETESERANERERDRERRKNLSLSRH